jgi:hypothetical protein
MDGGSELEGEGFVYYLRVELYCKKRGRLKLEAAIEARGRRDSFVLF